MIQSLIVDYNKSSNINKIEYSRIEYVNTFIRKIKFYNPEVNEPLHNFWYFITNAKIIKNSANNISIVLSSNDNKLIESINNLDEKINDIICKNTSVSNINSSIKKSINYPPIIELIIDSDSKFFNDENKIINCLDIRNNSKVQLYIELDSVILGTTKCDKKWRLIQLKQEKTLDIINMFDIPIPVPPILPPAPVYHKIIQSSHKQEELPVLVKKEEKKEKVECVFLPPSKNDLLNMLGKLKKSNNTDDIKPISKDINLNETSVDLLNMLGKLKSVKKENVSKDVSNDMFQYIKEQKELMNVYKEYFKKDKEMAKDIINNMDRLLKNNKIVSDKTIKIKKKEDELLEESDDDIFFYKN